MHNIPLLRDIVTEPNFVKGDINTNYLPNVYSDGFQGRQLSKADINSLASIASAIFLHEASRSSKFTNRDPRSQLFDSFVPNTHSLYVDMSSNSILKDEDVLNVKVSKNKDRYQITLGDFNVEIVDDFSLSSMTIDFDINGETKTAQLLSLNADGTIQIQYEGTIVIIRKTIS